MSATNLRVTHVTLFDEHVAMKLGKSTAREPGTHV